MHRRSGTKHCSRLIRAFTLLEVMIVVLTIGILLTVAIPNFLSARKRTQKVACIANLKRIEEAKELASTELGIGQGESINEGAVIEYLGSSKVPNVAGESLMPIVPPVGAGSLLPRCPGGGNYDLGTIGTSPTCSLEATEGHALP